MYVFCQKRIAAFDACIIDKMMFFLLYVISELQMKEFLRNVISIKRNIHMIDQLTFIHGRW